MRSSSGKYYIGLDHIRAIAVFMVFSWHFLHAANETLKYYPSVFILSILNEGHTGVALFMTLSGYLFAKLIDDNKIIYKSFIFNRILRLIPLLFFVIIFKGFWKYYHHDNLYIYAESILWGTIKPTLPNGGFSVTTEFHFYLILPLLLWLSKKSRYALFLIICLAVVTRLFLRYELGEIQSLAYYTIVGRLDQFIFGIIAYQLRHYITGRHFLAIGSLTGFILFYWYFETQGGFYNNPSYPSPSIIWVFIPDIEGLCYALLISWYDNSFSHSNNKTSRFIAQIGVYSYSIYLLHFFVVFRLSRFINKYLIDLSNFYLNLTISCISFLIMIPLVYLSYRFIESPFLKLRTTYIVKA